MIKTYFYRATIYYGVRKEDPEAETSGYLTITGSNENIIAEKIYPTLLKKLETKNPRCQKIIIKALNTL